MQETIQFIIGEIRGMWRFRWSAMLAAWVVCCAGWLYVYTMSDIYEARAQVFVDADSRLVEVMGQVGVAPGVGDAVFIVRQAMLGRPQLENVAADTGLAARAENEEEFDRLMIDLRETIIIESGRGSDGRDLYTISFTDSDREMAVSVVTALLNRFVTDVLELNDQGSQQATGYLDDQLTYYGNKLSEVEGKLAEFKKNNLGLLPGDRGGIFEKLQEEMDLLKRLRLDVSIETDRRDALRQQIRSESPNLPPGVTASGGAEVFDTPTEAAIRRLESSRATLLLSYTSRHPDVTAIDEQLEQLYEKRKEEVAALAAQSGGIEGAVNANNPVYQSVQIALNKSSIVIAGLQSEIAQHEEVVRQLKNDINTIPDVEAKYSQLNRDYEQYRTLYNQLLVQKERERMGEAGESREVVSFNIIEPPAAALNPVAPPRTLLLIAVLLLGAGAGAGVAYLKHIGHPVFNDLKTLRAVTGRPVLGGISMTWVEEHRRERILGFAAFAATGACLLVVFVLSVVFKENGVAAMRWLLSSSG